MVSPRRRGIGSAVAKFADDLRGVTQQLNDGVNFLSRAIQHKPCVGARDFREVLSDLQDEVSDIASEVEILERFTVDAISFEELLGHCLGLYQTNRATIKLLEGHLGQYGYQPPPYIVLEPEDPFAVAPNAAMDSTSVPDHGREDMDVDAIGPEAFNPSRIQPDSVLISSHAAGRYGAKKVTLKTPGPAGGVASAGPGSRRSGMRKPTPGGKRAVMASDTDAEVSDEDAQRSRQQQQEAPASVRPMGTLTGKGQVLAAAHAASWSTALTAAAAVHASARKAPRPSMDSRGSTTPEAMLLSPTMAKLLAKYNASGDGTRGSGHAMLPVTDPNKPEQDATGRTPGSDAITAAMSGLTPFGRPATRPVSMPAAAPAHAALSGSGAAQQPDMQQQRHRAPVQTPPSEDDTCSLYQELIRSRDVPASLAQQQLQQHKPQQRKPVGQLPHSGTGASGHQGTSSTPPQHGSRMASQCGQAAAAPVNGAASMTPTAPGAREPSRSVTPRSVARSEWPEHDRVLADKLAGLEREWVESGQAALTPLRRSWAGPIGAAVAAGDAAGRAHARGRSRSPAPLHPSAAEGPPRGAHLNSALYTSHDGALLGRAAGQAAVGPRPGGAPVPPLKLDGLARCVDPGRVLSPVQPPVAVHEQGRARTGWAADVSNAAASGQAPATTVVGTSVGLQALRSPTAVAGTTPKASAKPRGTPRRVGRGTPGRAPQPSMSPPKAEVSPSHAGIRGVDATTPGKAARGGGGKDRATPLRKSCTALTPGKGAMLAASANVTPGKLAKAGPAAPAQRTPSRVKVPAGASAWPEAALAPAGSRPHVADALMVDVGTGARNVPALRMHRQTWGSDASDSGAGSDWNGFQLGQPGINRGAAPALSSGGASDEVTLGMPPAHTSQPPTPSALRESLVAGANMLGLSPGASDLLSRALGDGFSGFRPQAVAAGPSLAAPRIPAPAATSLPKAAEVPGVARSAWAVPPPAQRPSPLAASRSFGRPLVPPSAAAVATAAAMPLVEQCGEEEWRGLPARTQQAFPLDALNRHLRDLTTMVASRSPADMSGAKAAGPAGNFSVADVELLGLSTISAKLLLNTLVKLGRCDVVSGVLGSGMQYRIRA